MNLDMPDESIQVVPRKQSFMKNDTTESEQRNNKKPIKTNIITDIFSQQQVQLLDSDYLPDITQPSLRSLHSSIASKQSNQQANGLRRKLSRKASSSHQTSSNNRQSSAASALNKTTNGSPTAKPAKNLREHSRSSLAQRSNSAKQKSLLPQKESVDREQLNKTQLLSTQMKTIDLTGDTLNLNLQDVFTPDPTKFKGNGQPHSRLSNAPTVENIPPREQSYRTRKLFKKMVNQHDTSDLIRNTPSGLTNQSSKPNFSVTQQFNTISGANKSFKAPAGWVNKKRVNQFKAKNMEPNEIINFLQIVCRNNVQINSALLPKDLDSTDALDSFLAALSHVISSNLYIIEESILDTIHLATGMRTEFCIEIFNYLARHQSKEGMFIDAIEFFQDSLFEMVSIRAENEERKKQIQELIQKKQELTMKSFDLERKLNDSQSQMSLFKERDEESMRQLTILQKQLHQKTSEAESLSYRVQHLENQIKKLNESNQQLQAKQVSVISMKTLKSDKIDQVVPAASDAEENTLSDQQKEYQVQLEQELENIKQLLYNKQSSDFQENTDYVLSIQNIMNKVQIDNKNLKLVNNKLHEKLQSRERLVTHLEKKIGQIMVEKEEKIVKLKSEIVQHRNKLEQNDKEFDRKLELMKQNIKEDVQQEFQKIIDDNESKIADLSRDTIDQQTRINRLQQDYEEITTEFQRYRQEKAIQEDKKAEYLDQVEEKLVHLNKINIEQKIQLTEKNENLESSSAILKKENTKLQLKIKYLRQNVETLLKQKVFLNETLIKFKNEINDEMQTLERSLLSENKSNSYLVSVEKAITQSQKMCDMGKVALDQLVQIVKFLKIEKLFDLLQDEPELEASQIKLKSKFFNDLIQAQEKTNTTINTQTNENDSVSDSDLTPEVQKQKKDKNKSFYDGKFKVQRMLDSLQTAFGSLPINFRGNSRQNFDLQSGILRDEEYFLVNCPVELSSILLKFIVELIIQIGHVDKIEEIPECISKLLFLANQKSDLALEKELYDNYLKECKTIIEQEMNTIKIQLQAEKEKQNLAFLKNQHKTYSSQLPTPPLPVSPNDNKVQSQSLTSITQPSVNLNNQDESLKIIDENQRTLQSKRGSLQSQDTNAKKEMLKNMERKSKQDLLQKAKNDALIGDLQLQVNELKLLLQEKKIKSKELAQSLAARVVQQEETLDQLKQQQADHIAQIEKSYRQEIEQIKQGVKLREQQLVDKIQQKQLVIDNYKQELEDQQLLYEKELQQMQAQVQNSANQSHTNLDMSLRPQQSAIRRMPTIIDGQYEKAQDFRTSTQHSIQTTKDADFQDEIQQVLNDCEQIQQQFNNYKKNIQEVVQLRESNRNTFSITFQLDETNSSLLSEAMLGYYLSKALMISKDKIRILSSDQFSIYKPMLDSKPNIQGTRKPTEPVNMVKINFEIIDSQANINNILLKVKAEIRDGTCILYDLQPTSFIIHLGQSGLDSRQNLLSQMTVIQKKGVIIDGVDYIVSILKSNCNPFIFSVVMLSLEHSEEHCVELIEQDIFQLCEGDQGLLQKTDNEELTKRIISSLALIKRDGIKFLVCEQKIFLNSIWHDNLQSKYHRQPHQQSLLESSVLKDCKLVNSPSYQYTSKRNQKILDQRQFKYTLADKSVFVREAITQTDFKPSLLYDYFQTVYNGNQSLSESLDIQITIRESQKENIVMILFEESICGQTAQFCLFNHKNKNEIELNIEDDIQDQTSYINPNQYVIHSECIKLDEGHFLLVTVEKIQKQGLLIKLNDLLNCLSESFYLQRKTNGQYVRYNTPCYDHLVLNQEFRNTIFDLSFQINAPGNQLILANISQSQEKMISKGKDPTTVMHEVFVLPRQKKTNKIIQFSKIAFYREINELNKPTMLEDQWHSSGQDKGKLLFRDCLIVRCKFDRSKELEQHHSLISLYLKQNEVSIEVFLYKNPVTQNQKQTDEKSAISQFDDSIKLQSKMSITSTVNAIDFFRQDPTQIEFTERINMLQDMLQKLFIIKEGDRFHMTVEGDAEPINSYMQNHINLAKSPTILDNKRSSVSQVQNEEKIRDFQVEKENLVSQQKALLFNRYVNCNTQTFTLKIYVMLRKLRNKQYIKSKRINTINKTNQDIVRQQIEQYIEENCEFDIFYLETINEYSDNEDLIFQMFDRRRIASILSRDALCKWKPLLQSWNDKLIDYIKQYVQINTDDRTMDVFNTSSVQKLIEKHCRTTLEGRLITRQANQVVEGFTASDQQMAKRDLLLNQEVEFIECCYDIKIYKVFYDEKDPVINAYQVEIFDINEPDIIYKCKYPLNLVGDQVQDPLTISSFLFNIVQSPEAAKFNEAEEDDNKTDDGGAYELEQQPSRKLQQQKSTDFNLSNKEQNNRINQIMLDHKTKFYQLFNNYIDNQLVLFIQERKFPQQLQFALYETASKLNWTWNYEPEYDIVSPCNFSLVDQGTKETFLTVYLDQLQKKGILDQIDQSQIQEQKVNWDSIIDNSNESMFIESSQLNNQLKATIFKNKGLLFVCLHDKSYTVPHDLNIEKQPSQSSIISKPQRISTYINEPIIEDQAATFIDHQKCLEMRFGPVGEHWIVNKLINYNDLDENSVKDALVLSVSSNSDSVKVKVFRVSQLQQIFYFKMKLEKSQSNVQNSGSMRSSLQAEKTNVLEIVKALNGEHTLEQMHKNYAYFESEKNKDITQKQKTEMNNVLLLGKPSFFDVRCQIHQSRFNQRVLDRQQSIVLHRKVFFEDTIEKMFIVQAKISFMISSSDGSSTDTQSLTNDYQIGSYQHLLPQDIEEIEFSIREAESDKVYSLVTKLDSCFSERDLIASNKRRLNKLKQFAKTILEERATIKLLDEGSQEFTLEINDNRMQTLITEEEQPSHTNNQNDDQNLNMDLNNVRTKYSQQMHPESQKNHTSVILEEDEPASQDDEEHSPSKHGELDDQIDSRTQQSDSQIADNLDLQPQKSNHLYGDGSNNSPDSNQNNLSH